VRRSRASGRGRSTRLQLELRPVRITTGSEPRHAART
jgi:hypothetical protein